MKIEQASKIGADIICADETEREQVLKILHDNGNKEFDPTEPTNVIRLCYDFDYFFSVISPERLIADDAKCRVISASTFISANTPAESK